MNLRKKSNFSNDGEYFAVSSEHGSLKIWETSTNALKHDYILKSSANISCSSLIWGPNKHDVIVDEVEENIKHSNCQCLVIGTEKGDILLFDFITGKFYNHFVTSHSESVNDLCWHSDSSSLFSCSTDKLISIWDLSGKLKKSWEADDEPLYSICVIDSDNLLVASTSISWWNMKQQTLIKKFRGHNTEILSLFPVIGTDESSKSYFLSVSADSKISAWHLNIKNSKTAVASFNIQGDDIESIDVTKTFSKNNPIFLSAVVKDGPLYLFKHVLNGKPKKDLEPQMTLQIQSKASSGSSKPSSIPIIASQFSSDFKSCLIAYGNIENPTFEKVEIVDCPKTLTLSREKQVSSPNNSVSISEVRIYNRLGEYISVNGTLPSLNSTLSSPKRKKLKEPNKNASCNERSGEVELSDRIPSSTHKSDSRSPGVKKKQRKISNQSITSESSNEDTNLPHSSNIGEELTRCLQTENVSLLDVVLQCDESDLVRSSVQRIPVHKLKFILQELYKRLSSQQNRFCSKMWLEKILSVHLNYIMQNEDLQETINLIENYFSQQRTNDKLLKMVQLQRLISLFLQMKETGYSDSDKSDEEMET